MFRIRFDTTVDAASGRIYAEAFYPDDATEPFASTDPIYATHEEAKEDMRSIVKTAFENNS